MENAALLIDGVLPRLPMRQWVLSVPFQLRYLFASQLQVMGNVLGIVYRAIENHLIIQAGETRNTTRTGAVTLFSGLGHSIIYRIAFGPQAGRKAFAYSAPLGVSLMVARAESTQKI